MNYPYYNLAGVIATALVNLSRRKGYTVGLVNSAYTW